MAAREAVLGGQCEEPGRARVGRLVDRMPEAGDRLLSRLEALDDLPGCGAGLASRRSLLEHASRLLDRPSEAVAHAQQAGRDRRLERLGSPVVGQPRRQRARSDAVLDQRHGDGVEHHRFPGAGQPAAQLQEREVAERHLADEVGRQVVAADEDLVGRAPAQTRAQLAAHLRTVSRVL